MTIGPTGIFLFQGKGALCPPSLPGTSISSLSSVHSFWPLQLGSLRDLPEEQGGLASISCKRQQVITFSLIPWHREISGCSLRVRKWCNLWMDSADQIRAPRGDWGPPGSRTCPCSSSLMAEMSQLWPTLGSARVPWNSEPQRKIFR